MKKLIIIASVLLTTLAFAEYTEQKVIDRIEVLEDGQIQIREAIRVYKDGVEITKTYHRHCLDVEDSLVNENAKVVAIANVVWTKEVKDARKAAKLLEKQKMGFK